MTQQSGAVTAHVRARPIGRRNERVAQLLAYLSPYLFWGTVCTLTGGIWLLQ
jgi:hypothetical protein